MHLLKRVGLLISVLGLFLISPPLTNWLTLHLGSSFGHYTGIVAFVFGWAIIGSSLAFSAGSRYQQEKQEKKAESPVHVNY